MARFSFFFSVVALYCGLNAVVQARPSSSSRSLADKTINYWFSFGDSYTDTGFNPTGPLPNEANPLGNPAFPGKTNTGGPNWVGWVTGTYNTSTLLTYNYAYGGATIDRTLVAPGNPSVRVLTDQVNEFLDGAAKSPKVWTSDNALFSIWIGINDIGGTWNLGGDRNAFNDKLLDAYFALVQKLYDAGARNFLFVNVPPVDRTPMILRNTPAQQATERDIINSYNSKLADRVTAFVSNNNVGHGIYDSHSQFTQILNNPTQYGFKDATSYGSGNNFFWGNDYHPSSKAHQLFGQTVGKDILGGTGW
ncbi:GDSL lipase/esterase [Crepidotus variabilis]|uniref:GDSL lipase/esterase n=1 Tax=Crepidotus variabilis TaxID=179855 RepID=A0A9P6JQW9_9AGAR|nr:GDSL lipase/esterase [Crepidotus variabilis]